MTVKCTPGLRLISLAALVVGLASAMVLLHTGRAAAATYSSWGALDARLVNSRTTAAAQDDGCEDSLDYNHSKGGSTTTRPMINGTNGYRPSDYSWLDWISGNGTNGSQTITATAGSGSVGAALNMETFLCFPMINGGTSTDPDNYKDQITFFSPESPGDAEANGYETVLGRYTADQPPNPVPSGCPGSAASPNWCVYGPALTYRVLYYLGTKASYSCVSQTTGAPCSASGTIGDGFSYTQRDNNSRFWFNGSSGVGFNINYSNFSPGQTYQITVTMPTQSMNVYYGTTIECVAPGGALYTVGNVSSVTTGSFAPCQTGSTSYTVYVTIPDQPPLLWIDTPNNSSICSNDVAGWSFDPDSSSVSDVVAVYVDGTAPSNLIYYHTTDFPRPDVNSAFSISGTHGFDLSAIGTPGSDPLPSSLLDGNSHTFYIYAIDNETGGNVGPGSQTGGVDPVTLTGCKGYSYNPSPNVTDVNGNTEDPSSLTFSDTTGYSVSGGTPTCVNGVTVNYTIYQNDVNGNRVKTITPSTNDGPRCVGSETKNYLSGYPPGTFSAGDSFCIQVSISPGAGYVDSSGNQIGAPTVPQAPNNPNSTPPYTATKCFVVTDKPFYKAYQGSVYSGGEFKAMATGCNQLGTLGGWYNNNAGDYGSSTQLAALGNSLIKAFASGHDSYASANNLGDTYLTFANKSVAISTNSADPTLGGNLGSTHCLETPLAPTTPGPSPASSPLTPGASGSFTYNGNLTINGGLLNNGTNEAIFVNGNVYINGNITYNNTGWTVDAPGAPSNVPSFWLVVTNGNVYISNNVTELDGIYVAQNKPGINAITHKPYPYGRIYTCGVVSGGSFQPVAQNSIFGSCNNQLAIYGSFRADQVNLMRTYGSLRDVKSGHTSGCANAGAAAPTVSPSCAAEVFEWTPEIYMSNPSILPPGGGAPEADSITSLPPVL